jgi:gamma-glutamyltranspeptidase / glutathione hydrolase
MPLMLLVVALLAGCAAPGPELPRPFPRGVVAADHGAASGAGAAILRQGGNAVDAAVATSFALSVVRPYSCGIGGGGFMVIRVVSLAAPEAPDTANTPQSRRSDAGGHSISRPQPRAAASNANRDVIQLIALDYRETAPAAMTPGFYDDLPSHASTTGARAVGTPGTVAGLLYALENYGTMPRQSVLAPAIRLAEEGFLVDQHYVDSTAPLISRFRREPALQERFAFLWDRLLREGDVAVGDRIQLPEQAAALRLIAEYGAPAFYEGPIAEAILRAVERDGGIMTAEDLGTYSLHVRQPLIFSFDAAVRDGKVGRRTFITMPPPSSGGIAMAQSLGILERLAKGETTGSRNGQMVPRTTTGRGPVGHLASLVREAPSTPASAHALVESFKHAFADRAEWLADPDFVDVPVQRLLSPEYLDARAATFQTGRTLMPADYGTREREQLTVLPDGAGTSHFSVVDQWGNAVACTETINLTFGSLLAVDEFGFILNNEMDDFTTRAGLPNAFGLRQSDRNLPEPRKRPLSSMTPTIVLDPDGHVEVVAGASGGPRIITATTQVILHALGGMSAADSVAMPRIHHQWAPDILRIERGLADFPALEPSPEGTSLAPAPDAAPWKSLADALRARGHQVEITESLATLQLIVRDARGRGWSAASDPRKGGEPAGH